MPRYILVENETGVVVADTACVGEGAIDENPLEAVTRVERVIGLSDFECRYHYVTYHMSGAVPPWAHGYHVYLGEIDGRNLVPLIEHGGDPEVVQEVRHMCMYCGFVYIETIELIEDEV